MTHSKLAIGMIGGASALVLALSPSAALAHHGHHHHGHNLLRGDLTPSMPTDDPINGVDPGGLPWIISRGEVRVRDNGRMDVRIEGLQIPPQRREPTTRSEPSTPCCTAVAPWRRDSGPQPLSIPDGDARFRVHAHGPEDL